jgi:hypothetical protein
VADGDDFEELWEQAVEYSVNLGRELADAQDEIERLRAALRRRNGRPADEKLADLLERSRRNVKSRTWRIIGRLVRDIQNLETDRDEACELLYEAWVLISNTCFHADELPPPTSGLAECAERWRDTWHAFMDGAS